jgi:ribosomal protein S18 acetylase RimI-like enzyme
MSDAYRILPLTGQDRSRFVSGSDALDRYFREGVGQDIRRRLARCFIAIASDDEIAGFYTLAATSISLSQIKSDRARKLPRYPEVPSALLGRLAVARSHQGRNVGGFLVADALMRAAQSDIAAHLMIVDAKDEAAARFYEHLDFERLSEGSLRLIRAV